MAYQQRPPELGNQYDDDRVLRSLLRRTLPEEVFEEIRPSLQELGQAAGGTLYALQQADRLNEPVLTQWDAWGKRIDQVQVTRVWEEAERLAAEYGLVATAYEQRHGAFSRLHQFALVYLFTPATDLYSCPLAMTDGAAAALLAAGDNALLLDTLPHLTSRNPEHFWTSGQWMTEQPGGSDVGHTETRARLQPDGTWRLYGHKWFTSAVTSQMALALARPEGNPPGSKGLALFYVELRDEDGRLQHIRVERLKDKLGTRKLPTAELTLDGTPARLVGGIQHGVRAIAPMLNITRTWNAVCAVALMRRGLALARDYARKRRAFGAPLSQKPLHADTLAGLQAAFEGAFHLTFRVVELLGQAEARAFDAQEPVPEPLLRLLTPVAKLITGKQAASVLSEVLEAFGGAGYVEDTGLPALLRDAQVLPIWEGTTNVLSLDVLRALMEAEGLDVLRAEAQRCAEAVRDPSLAGVVAAAIEALDRGANWLTRSVPLGRAQVEAGARRFALTIGWAMELALLAHHAQWALENEDDARPAAAARRLAATPPPPLDDDALEESFALANDTPLLSDETMMTTTPEVTVPARRGWGDGAPRPTVSNKP